MEGTPGGFAGLGVSRDPFAFLQDRDNPSTLVFPADDWAQATARAMAMPIRQLVRVEGQSREWGEGHLERFAFDPHYRYARGT